MHLCVDAQFTRHRRSSTAAIGRTNGRVLPMWPDTPELLQGVSIAGYASPVLVTIEMSVPVCLSVRHTLVLSENDES